RLVRESNTNLCAIRQLCVAYPAFHSFPPRRSSDLWNPEDYEAAATIARAIARRVIVDGLPPGVLLNVNIPAIPQSEIRGILPTRDRKSTRLNSSHVKNAYAVFSLK